MDSAARSIAEGNLDFEMAPQRDDELGRLCLRFEDMRAELVRSKTEMWRSAESRQRVNAAFAHDLRTPLTVVRGRAEYIGMVSDNAKVEKAAGIILRQAEKLTAYADTMSGLGSLEDMPLEQRPIDPAELVARIAETAENAAREYGLQTFVNGDDCPSKIEADESFVLRVADNLVSNAVRHASDSVHVALSYSNGLLCLSVRDDGPGFGDAAGRALEPFWRGEDESAPCAGGSDGHMGLGLYICTELCARHGGSVSVRDEPDGGGLAVATFLAPPCDDSQNS